MRGDGKADIPFLKKQGKDPHLEMRRKKGALLKLWPDHRFSSQVETGISLSRKESQHYRRPSRGGGLNLKHERNSRGRATIPKDPEFPFHSRYTCFPCTDSAVTASIDSQRDGTCDSPLAPREKATDLYANSTGSLTLLLQLERKVHLHGSTRNKA